MNELFLYDDIGPEWLGMVGAKTVVNFLKDVGPKADIVVRINSPGGSVMEGQAMYNNLVAHKGKVTVAIDSLAASMGSYIAMAGDEIEIAPNAFIMIHNPWSFVAGDAEKLRHEAGVLDKVQDSAAEVYATRSGQTVDKVLEMMAAETWLTAQEAIDLGFANAIGPDLKAFAKVKEGRFAKTPKEFLLTANEQLPREKARSNRIEQVAAQIRLSRSRLGV